VGDIGSTDVAAYVAAIASPRRRRDAETMLGVMQRATRQSPELWGSIVGYGRYHYRYASGREGDAPAAGFAARKTAIVVYVSDGVGRHEDLLARLGPEIARARRLYEQRVPASRERAALFQHELVHTLAAGDATRLGAS